ncbi:MAG: DNA-binding protein [Clostridia bacterium]|nr:DNA-binding protein [Clostridia bacterium]
MDKIQFMRLWDLYGKLLTPNQQEITDMYFNLDLTVSEIAEQKGISRQGVSECLNLCKKQLQEYDDKLQHDRLLAEGDLLTSFMMTDVGIWAEKFVKSHPEYAEDIAQLTAILDKDYSQEIAAGLKKLGKE